MDGRGGGGLSGKGQHGGEGKEQDLADLAHAVW